MFTAHIWAYVMLYIGFCIYICAKNRKNPSSHPACRTIENESSMKPKPRSYIVCKMLLLWWHVAGLFHWRGSLRNPWWIIYKVMWSLWGSLLSGKIIMAERREDVWKVWMVLSAERHDQHIWTLCCTEWIWSSRRLYSFSSQEHSNVGQKSLRSNRERMSGHRVYFSRGSDVWVAWLPTGHKALRHLRPSEPHGRPTGSAFHRTSLSTKLQQSRKW